MKYANTALQINVKDSDILYTSGLLWEASEGWYTYITLQKDGKVVWKALTYKGFRGLRILLRYRQCKLLWQSLSQHSVNQAKETKERKDKREWKMESSLANIYSICVAIVDCISLRWNKNFVRCIRLFYLTKHAHTHNLPCHPIFTTTFQVAFEHVRLGL